MNPRIVDQDIHRTDPALDLRHTPLNVRTVRHIKTTPVHNESFAAQRRHRLFQSSRIDVVEQHFSPGRTQAASERKSDALPRTGDERTPSTQLKKVAAPVRNGRDRRRTGGSFVRHFGDTVNHF